MYEEQQFLISRQVEQFGLCAAPEQHGLQLRHRIQWRGPGTLDAADHQRIVFQRASTLRVGIPIRRDTVEALVEANPRAFVGLALAATPVDLEQLQVRQRNATARAAQVRHQQVDGGVVMAERDEEIGLLLEVDLLVDADGAIAFVLTGQRRRDRHRRRRRQRRRRQSASPIRRASRTALSAHGVGAEGIGCCDGARDAGNAETWESPLRAGATVT